MKKLLLLSLFALGAAQLNAEAETTAQREREIAYRKAMDEKKLIKSKTPGIAFATEAAS